MTVNFVRKSLRNKLIVILLTVSLSSIIIVGVLSYANARNSLQNAAMSALEANGYLKAQTIELFFKERSSDIKAAQDFFNVKTNLSILSKYIGDRTSPEYIAAKNMLDGQLRTFQKVYDYVDVMLVNSEGKIVYVTEETHSKIDLDNPLPDPTGKAFENGKKGLYFSDIFTFGENPGVSEMFVTAPVFDFDEKLVGVIALEIDMDPIYRLIQDRTGLGETGETLIGKKIGNEAVFLNPLHYNPDSNINRKISLGSNEAIPIQRAVQGLDGIGLSVDYRGEAVIAHWRHIPTIGWGLVAKIDQREAFASIISLRNNIIYISLFLIFLLVGFAFWISKKIVDPLNSLNKFADQVSMGDFSVYPKIQTEDEVGQLTTSFVNMSQKLQKHHTHLEELVKDRTAKLSFTNAELAKAARMKDEFLASMSHELRTPLNAILGLSEALQEGIYGNLNEKQINKINNIEESGRHLLSLINEILDLAKIEAGKVELEYNKISIEALSQASLRFIKQTASKKKIKVSTAFSTIIETFQADEKRMKQILVNLLNNAVKFTPEGGQIGLDVDTDDENQTISFSVWDTGIGISHENLDKLFRPFIQIDSKLSRQYEGTGLGLALVNNLTNLHNGSITVDSQEGKGSRFTVTIPLKDYGEKDIDSKLESEESGFSDSEIDKLEKVQETKKGQKLILLAEDNEQNIITVKDYLEAKQFQVIVTRNGKEALELTQEIKPDLILMDIQMPIMDGLEATKEIRAISDPKISDIPIIALTALAMPGDEEICINAGADKYMKKPVGLKNLVNTINELLEKA